jgi:hypothetical protein
MTLSRKLPRDAVLAFFASLSPCDVAMEASHLELKLAS